MISLPLKHSSTIFRWKRGRHGKFSCINFRNRLSKLERKIAISTISFIPIRFQQRPFSHIHTARFEPRSKMRGRVFFFSPKTGLMFTIVVNSSTVLDMTFKRSLINTMEWNFLISIRGTASNRRHKRRQIRWNPCVLAMVPTSIWKNLRKRASKLVFLLNFHAFSVKICVPGRGH